MSPFTAPPPVAAYRHVDAREGFEVAFFDLRPGGGVVVRGHTAAVEEGVAWAVEYTIELDEGWQTRRAHVRGRSAAGAGERLLERADGNGDGGGVASWLVDGVPEPDLDGCFDVDLESSAITNAFPVRRLDLAIGAGAPAPAVYVRAADLAVERLEQTYDRIAGAGGASFDYSSPRFDFRCVLPYDAGGLVADYPGIAVRVV